MHDGGCRTGAAAHRLRTKPARHPGDHGTGNRLNHPEHAGSPRNFRTAVVLFFGLPIAACFANYNFFESRGTAVHRRRRPAVQGLRTESHHG